MYGEPVAREFHLCVAEWPLHCSQAASCRVEDLFYVQSENFKKGRIKRNRKNSVYITVAGITSNLLEWTDYSGIDAFIHSTNIYWASSEGQAKIQPCPTGFMKVRLF